MRAFVAIPLPEQFEEWFRAYRLSTGTQGSRFVPASSCHITLKFLGEISGETADRAGSLLKEALGNCPAFSLALERTGVFLRNGRPAVLWLGPRHSPAGLQHVADRVRSALGGIGAGKQDDRFLPHVTLARFSGKDTPVDAASLCCDVLQPFAFIADRVILYESILGQGRPVYLSRETMMLRRFGE